MNRLLLLTLPFVVISTPVQGQNSRDIATTLRHNVVYIRAEREGHSENGFGFITGERNDGYYFVTANHVVRGRLPNQVATKIIVKFYGEDSVSQKAELLPINDLAADIAFLRVKRGKSEKLSGNLTDKLTSVLKKKVKERFTEALWFAEKKKTKLYRWDCLAHTENVAVGSSVYNMGNGSEWMVPEKPGMVTEISGNNLEISGLPIQPGCSGGPIIDENGIAGMLLSDSADSTSAVSIKKIQEVIEMNGLPWMLIPRGQEFDLSGQWRYQEEWEQRPLDVAVKRVEGDLIRWQFHTVGNTKGTDSVGGAIVQGTSVRAWWDNALWGREYVVFEIKNPQGSSVNLLEGVGIDDEDDEEYWIKLTRIGPQKAMPTSESAAIPATSLDPSNSKQIIHRSSINPKAMHMPEPAKPERSLGSSKSKQITNTSSNKPKTMRVPESVTKPARSLDSSKSKQITNTSSMKSKKSFNKIEHTSNVTTLKGCWKWSNGAYITISEGGMAMNGLIAGKWHKGGSTPENFTIEWPGIVDMVTLSQDAMTFESKNVFGNLSAERISQKNENLAGTWKRSDGAVLEISPDGNITCGPFFATWTKVNSSTFTFTWPINDNIALADDGNSLVIQNQFGVVTAQRDPNCSH